MFSTSEAEDPRPAWKSHVYYRHNFQATENEALEMQNHQQTLVEFININYALHNFVYSNQKIDITFKKIFQQVSK